MAQESSHTTLEMGNSDQVLVASKRKKKMTMIIGGVVLVVIIAVVITLAVVLSGNEGGDDDPVVVEPTTADPIDPTDPTGPTDPPDTDPPFVIEIEDIINGKFAPTPFTAAWVSGNSLMYRNEQDDLVIQDIIENTNRTVVDNSTEAGELLHRSSRFLELSHDQTHVAFAYDAVPVYRHSFLAHYAVVNIETQEHQLIQPPPPPAPAPARAESDTGLQNLVWGPQGTSFAFVYKNDIYYRPSLEAAAQRITLTGLEGILYNGIPDWVYEEEVFSSNVAMWFSRDGQRLAYATFDDTNVQIMKVPHYGVPGSVLYQYTAHHAIRYPKPGTTNPTVTVTLRDLGSTTSTTYQGPTTLDQPILLSVSFVTETSIALVWTNRVQNEMRVLLCTEGSTTCEQIFQHSEPEGWIDNNPLFFNNEGSSFVTILPEAVNGVRYKQVVQVTRGATAGEWTSQSRSNTAHTVIEIYRRTDDDVVWYKATSVEDSAEQHIYSVDSSQTVHCFSCEVKRSDGGDCLYNDGSFSTDSSRVAVNCAGPGIPQILLYATTGELISEWELNHELATALEDGGLPQILRYKVPVAEGLPDAEVQVQVPHNYQSRTDVPLLVYVYGGPDSALVTRQWSIDWGTSLVTRFGIAIAHIDGRGSGLRGVANMFALNRKLGTIEIEDQITVTKYLQDNLSWIDRSHTCIWGWSYGGYASSLALARGGGVFSCAMAVAPVTDWRFYDTIYTERYMDVPSNNLEGYAKSSLLNEEDVEGFRNKSYFLIHGTADDNVHYQHAMVLSRRLQTNNIFFTQMSYTDEDHGLVGVRPHLYHGMEKFLRENLHDEL